jgi:hypothetical protein
MKTATVIAVAALVLALVALVSPFWLNRAYSWVSPSSPMLRQQALATSIPFLGVALLAFVLTGSRRAQPDARVPRAGVGLLIVLLMASGCWLLLFVGTWGL